MGLMMAIAAKSGLAAGGADHIVRSAVRGKCGKFAAIWPARSADYGDDMPVRLRKLIGAVALLALVMVWALLAMALAQSALTDINGFVAALYYIVAGLGWVLPAMPIIAWMSKPAKAETEAKA